MRCLLLLCIFVISCKSNSRDPVPTTGTKDDSPIQSAIEAPGGGQGGDGAGADTDPVAENTEISLTVTLTKGDALYKTCLYISVNGLDYDKVSCNKGEPNPPLTTYKKSVLKAKCTEVSLKVDVFLPVNRQTCIDAIQADRANHSCDYQTEPNLSEIYGASQRYQYELSSESPTIHLFRFEDGDDADFREYQFYIDASSVEKLKFFGFSTCDAAE